MRPVPGKIVFECVIEMPDIAPVGCVTSTLGTPFDGPEKKPPVVGKKAPLLRSMRCGEWVTDRWEVECIEAELPCWAGPD